MKFLLIDSDYTFDRSNNPIIRLYGKTIDNDNSENDGKDVIVHVSGFEPYFICDNAGIDIFELQKKVEKILRGYVKRVEMVMRFRPIGYQINKVPMLRMVLFNPKTTPECREMLKANIEEMTNSMIYEADIPFNNRYMVDSEMNGMDIISFNEQGKSISNYGVNCNNLYLVEKNEIKVLKDEVVKIEY